MLGHPLCSYFPLSLHEIFSSSSTLLSTYQVYLWFFPFTMDYGPLLLPVCPRVIEPSPRLLPRFTSCFTLHSHQTMSAVRYSKMIFARGFHSNQGGLPHGWAWARMTLLGHFYTLLMVLPLPFSFRLSWILLFTQNNLDFIASVAGEESFQTKSCWLCRGAHWVWHFVRQELFQLGHQAGGRFKGRRWTRRRQFKCYISSFALMTTRVEKSVHGSIAHRPGTALICFPHKHYSCFHIGGKKDKINEIKKEVSVIFWHSLCAMDFSILLCPAQYF